MFDTADTIVAVASAAGGAPRGILRLSGPHVFDGVTQTFIAASGDPRQARVPRRFPGALRLPPPLGDVPCDLYIWPSDRSYTRQPSAELHLPGSPPILEAALTHLCRHGARLAQPGEFTLRAFLAGRIDLTQAEAVLGVIDAASQRELEVALKQLAGGLAAPLQELRERLLDLLAHLEAGLDFVEEDIEFITAEALDAELAEIGERLERLADQMDARQSAGETFRVVLFGEPNAGKSSLLNALAGEQAAIVSSSAGTTRDYVTRAVTIDGMRCELTDTAGLGLAREDEASPDGAAELQARERIAEAHLTLLCLDATASRTLWEMEQLRLPGERTLVVWCKSDLASEASFPFKGGVAVSSRAGAGLDRLRAAIAERLASQTEIDAQVVAGTAARCRDSLRLTAAALERARQLAAHRLGEELVASELRVGLDELGRVVGAIYTDDVLDRIFSRFCIGK